MAYSAARPNASDLGAGAWATFLYGPSRELLHRVAFGLGRANHPTPYWLCVCDEAGPEMDEPIRRGWVDGDHAFMVAAPDTRPQEAVPDSALWKVVRADEPRSVLAEFADFMRLPGAVQEAVSRTGGESSRPVLVVANSDRARRFYPKDPEGVSHVIDPLRRSQLLPIFVSAGTPGAGRRAFDFVLEVHGVDARHWREGELVVEKAPAGVSFHQGDSIPLPSLPELAGAFEGSPNPA